MNEKTTSTKKKNKWLLPLVLLLLVGLCGGGYYAYSQGYLDQFLNKEVVEEPVVEVPQKPDWADPDYRPEGYKEPTITFKEGYEEGRIIVVEGTKFNARDYIKITSHNNRGQLIVDFVGDELPEELEVGVYSGFLTYRDMYKAETSVPFSLEVMPEDTTEEEIEVIKKKSGHWEEKTEVIPGFYKENVIQKAYDERVISKEAYTEEKYIEAYTETKLVKAAYDERVIKTPAWDETIEYCAIMGWDQEYMYICSGCGARFSSPDAVYAHIDAEIGDACNSYSGQNVDVGEQHCLEYGSRIQHHDAEYEIIHHDAEYQEIYHPAETKYINHPAEYRTIHHDKVLGDPIWVPETTRTYRVWVED